MSRNVALSDEAACLPNTPNPWGKSPKKGLSSQNWEASCPSPHLMGAVREPSTESWGGWSGHVLCQHSLAAALLCSCEEKGRRGVSVAKSEVKDPDDLNLENGHFWVWLTSRIIISTFQLFLLFNSSNSLTSHLKALSLAGLTLLFCFRSSLPQESPLSFT